MLNKENNYHKTALMIRKNERHKVPKIVFDLNKFSKLLMENQMSLV